MKICYSLLLFISISSFGQVQNIGRETNQFSTWDLTREIDPKAIKDKISGTVYATEDFFNAKIKINDTIFKVPVKYNILLDEMEFKKDDKIYALVVKEPTTVYIISSNKTYSYETYKLDEVIKKGFLVCKTANNNVNYFSKEVVIYSPFKEASNAYSQAKPASYVKQSDLIFIGIKNNIVEMPTKKKDFFTLFPGKEKEIKAFLESNKTSLKLEKDLLLLINYLDTL